MSSVATDLDDFFKKRDKKKKNTKNAPKFSKLDTKEVAKQLQAIAQQNTIENEDESELGVNQENINSIEQQIVNNEVNVNIINQNNKKNMNTAVNDQNQSTAVKTIKFIKSHQLDSSTREEDWIPFESEEHKDYSGLRVNITENWKNDDDSYNNDEDEIEGDSDKKANFPWSSIPKINNTKSNISENNEIETTDNQEIDNDTTTVPTTGKYIPPGLRAQLMKTNNSNEPQFKSANQSRRNKNQPNINDICEFPSLSDIPTDVQTFH